MNIFPTVAIIEMLQFYRIAWVGGRVGNGKGVIADIIAAESVKSGEVDVVLRVEDCYDFRRYRTIVPYLRHHDSAIVFSGEANPRGIGNYIYIVPAYKFSWIHPALPDFWEFGVGGRWGYKNYDYSDKSHFMVWGKPTTYTGLVAKV